MGEFEKLKADHEFLVAVLTDIRNALKRDGGVLAKDKSRVFHGVGKNAEFAEAHGPTVLELLDGYVAERKGGKIPR